MTVTHIKRTLHDRVTHLEERAKAHDAMAEQVKEMYEAWAKAKTLKAMGWFRVTIVGGAFATLGAIAVVLTIAEKAAVLFGHHGP
jgi:hypothetical protein